MYKYISIRRIILVLFFLHIYMHIVDLYILLYDLYDGRQLRMFQAVWSLLIKLDDSCAHDALVISAIAVLSSVALHQLGSTFHGPQWWPKSKSMFFLKG